MRALIYAADDDPSLRGLLEMFLSDAGFDIKTFPTGDALLAAFRELPCDLAILDVMMPGTDGIAVCKKLRGASSVPVVLLTARDSEIDYAAAFHSGSDDYVIKPFRPSLLVMKIKALLRRTRPEGSEGAAERLSFGDLSFDAGLRQARCGAGALPLTPTELRLLAHLLRRGGQAVSRDELLGAVWGYGCQVETRVADETVRRLRNKLAEAGSRAEVRTIWGFGYRLAQGGDGA